MSAEPTSWENSFATSANGHARGEFCLGLFYTLLHVGLIPRLKQDMGYAVLRFELGFLLSKFVRFPNSTLVYRLTKIIDRQLKIIDVDRLQSTKIILVGTVIGLYLSFQLQAKWKYIFLLE